MSDDDTKVINCSAFAGGEYPFISRGPVSMVIKNCIADNCLVGTLYRRKLRNELGVWENNIIVNSENKVWKYTNENSFRQEYDENTNSYTTVEEYPTLKGNEFYSLADLASGKACYDMNQKLGGNYYTQKLNTDPIPYPTGSHGQVYKVKQYSSCVDYVYTYSNEPYDITDNVHHYFHPDVATCNHCSAPNPDHVLTKVDGYYQIGTAADFKKFANMVNENVLNINVRLTADIDLGGETIVPLKEYSGEIDGAGHTISNFFLRTYESSRDGGLVGCLQGGGKIHDLTLSGYIFAQPNTNLGAFAGRVKEGCELRNLRNDCMLIVQGTIYSGRSEMNVGGIAGLLEGTAECCINNGQVLDTSEKVNYSATIRMGGLVGYAKKTAEMTKLVNNAFVGSNSFTKVWGDAIAYCEVETNAPTQSYYVNDFERHGYNYFFSEETTAPGATAVSKDQLGSGEVCYQLNGSKSPAQTSDLSFGQKIGTDVAPYPYVNAAHPGVYPAKFYYNCTQYSNYSNVATDGTPRGHVYTEGKHYCDQCFMIDDTMEKVDGVYQITSAADFNLFAQAVNAACASTDAKAMRFASAALTTSFTLDGDNYTPINTLSGTLNGKGNTITMTVNNYTGNKRLLVENLASTGLITFLNLKGQYRTEDPDINVAAIVGSNYSTVSNCMAINAMLQFGNHGDTFIDCISDWFAIGAIWAGTMTRVATKESDGGYVIYNGHGTKENAVTNLKKFTASEAKDGTMAYYLSHMDPSQPCVWGQVLGIEDEPRICYNQTPASATFVTTLTYYSIDNKEGSTQLYNANTPLNPGAGGFMVYGDGESSLYLNDPNNIVANPDGTYSAKRINLDPTAQNYLPIEVEAEQFTFCKTVDEELVPVTCAEGELVSLVFPVDMPISNINGTVYLFEGFREETSYRKLLIFNSDLDFEVIPANTPIIVKAKGGNILNAALENVHVYPMMGSQTVTIGDDESADAMPITHYVSYNNEQTMKMADTPDKKTVFYTLGYDETEVYYPRTFDNPVTVSPMNSFFTIANATKELPYKNLTLSFSDPASTLTAVAGVLNSICPEHDGFLTAPEGQTLDIYVFAGISGGYVYGIPVKDAYGLAEGYVCAGVPYIFVTNGTSVTFNRTFTDYDYERYKWYGEYNATYRASQKNGLQGVLKGDGAQLHGHDYIVFTRNGLKYAPSAEGKTVTVGRGKCFIDNSTPAPAQAQARRIASFDEEANGIEEIRAPMTPTTPIYNMQGLRVSDSYKGIVIVNGKKTIRK